MSSWAFGWYRDGQKVNMAHVDDLDYEEASLYKKAFERESGKEITKVTLESGGEIQKMFLFI